MKLSLLPSAFNLLLIGYLLDHVDAFAFQRNHQSPFSVESFGGKIGNNNPFTALSMSSSNDENEKSVKTKKPGKLDPTLRTKLVSESIAPWRTLRLFLYGSLGSGALLGGVISLIGILAGNPIEPPAVDVTTAITDTAASATADPGEIETKVFGLVGGSYVNVAIDFGAVLFFALCAKFDLDKKEELDQKVEERMVKKKEQSKLVKGMREREQALSNLLLNVQIAGDGERRDLTIRDLQLGARQHMIIVIGPRKACRDALIGANLLRMDFALSNVLVVPYETPVDAMEEQSRPTGGFGERPTYEMQPYIARASGEGWEEYIDAEVQDAVSQSGEQVLQEGIVIVVASDGTVIRRGVGKVPWRQTVQQLEEAVGAKTAPQS